MKIVKGIFYFIWIAAIVVLLIFFIASPQSFTAENIADFLSRYNNQLMFIYIIVSLVRGLFLIPSTPFVLAGIPLFPDQPFFVFIVSLVGVAAGATMVYYMSDLLGFSKKLEEKYPSKIEKWHQRLNSPKASLIVIAWSFFPLVPTDIICYVAGIVKMPYRFLIAGVMIGEIVLIYLYVYGGMALV
ncbi:VTT domain-containing protein [Paracrocinitomix mangrovi]|uniref:TVP38/TMEM64 family protein n=1 Tax=Paracrocinitomix mangrovi TaxID=2862509 RepID=UPI001C8D8BA3|nr:VTT domain-containing protein [Paracrocinitomix mangrovi]UKN00114.1 VTT domain-containing protein [Paracrocinitomix mangrovi]